MARVGPARARGRGQGGSRQRGFFDVAGPTSGAGTGQTIGRYGARPALRARGGVGPVMPGCAPAAHAQGRTTAKRRRCLSAAFASSGSSAGSMRTQSMKRAMSIEP